LAQARSQLDGSPFCFNFVCLNCVAARWMTRTAYGLRGTPVDDTIKSMFFPCCNVNQLYQTTKRYGNPAKFGGRLYNQESYRGDVRKKDCCYNFVLAAVCNPCATGSAVETATGMPWVMACCCVNPFLARNIIRYHWRLKGDDAVEMLAPLLCLTADQFVMFPYGIVSFYGLGSMLVTMQLLAETEARGADTASDAKRYLTGYSMEGMLTEPEDGEVVYEDVVGRSLVEVSSTHKQPELTPAAAVINETVVVQAPKS